MSHPVMGLGCGCCDDGCPYTLCVRAQNKCTNYYIGGSTITFDGPNGEHYEYTTGGGGTSVAQSCLYRPAAGDWTVTVAADDYQAKTTTITVTECSSRVVTVQLCPTKVNILVLVGGDCRPWQSCGPILVELSGPGVITPSGAVDFWDYVEISGHVPFEVDLSGVELDDDCEASPALSWEATATPPSGTGHSPVTSSSDGIYGSCIGPWITCEFNTPEDKVCCGGVLRPKTLSFSDDYGACTLTHGAASNIYPWWSPWQNSGIPLSGTHPWIGSYSFVCEEGCADEPCEPYGNFGVAAGPLEVTVTIAASCNEVVKIISYRPSCTPDIDLCLHSHGPMDGGGANNAALYMCHYHGIFTGDPCSEVVDESGSWVLPFFGCSGGVTDVPCVGGNWIVTG